MHPSPTFRLSCFAVHVTIYTAENCSLCKKALFHLRRLLRAHSLPFIFVSSKSPFFFPNITAPSASRKSLLRISERSSTIDRSTNHSSYGSSNNSSRGSNDEKLDLGPFSSLQPQQQRKRTSKRICCCDCSLEASTHTVYSAHINIGKQPLLLRTGAPLHQVSCASSVDLFSQAFTAAVRTANNSCSLIAASSSVVAPKKAETASSAVGDAFRYAVEKKVLKRQLQDCEGLEGDFAAVHIAVVNLDKFISRQFSLSALENQRQYQMPFVCNFEKRLQQRPYQQADQRLSVACSNDFLQRHSLQNVNLQKEQCMHLQQETLQQREHQKLLFWLRSQLPVIVVNGDIVSRLQFDTSTVRDALLANLPPHLRARYHLRSEESK